LEKRPGKEPYLGRGGQKKRRVLGDERSLGCRELKGGPREVKLILAKTPESLGHQKKNGSDEKTERRERYRRRLPGGEKVIHEPGTSNIKREVLF